jgi:hypothetical protein
MPLILVKPTRAMVAKVNLCEVGLREGLPVVSYPHPQQ